MYDSYEQMVDIYTFLGLLVHIFHKADEAVVGPIELLNLGPDLSLGGAAVLLAP